MITLGDPRPLHRPEPTAKPSHVVFGVRAPKARPDHRGQAQLEALDQNQTHGAAVKGTLNRPRVDNIQAVAIKAAQALPAADPAEIDASDMAELLSTLKRLSADVAALREANAALELRVATLEADAGTFGEDAA